MQDRRLSAPQIVQLGLHRPFGGVPQLLVDVDVDVFDDLARGGVVAELRKADTDLIEPLFAVRQIALGYHSRSARSGPCPGSTVRPPSPRSRRSESR